MSNVVPDYVAPPMVSAVHRYTSALRFLFSRNFADLTVSDGKASYVGGLVLYTALLLVVALLWTALLVRLKRKGDVVGCASGKPFQTVNWRFSEVYTEKKTAEQSDSSGSPSNEVPANAWRATKTIGIVLSNSADSVFDEEQTNVEERLYPEIVERNIRRQRRTRAAFLSASIASIVCSCLLIGFGFSSIHQAVNETERQVMESQTILDQVGATLGSISSAADNASNSVMSTDLSYTTICPNLRSDIDLNATVGVYRLTELMMKELATMELSVKQNLINVNETMLDVQGGLDMYHSHVNQSNACHWALLAVLLFVITVTFSAAVALILSWRGHTALRFRRTLKRFVVPSIIIVAMTCWASAIGASTASILTSDACLAGPSENPSATIQSILDKHNANPNGYVYEMVTAYTGGCNGEEPTTGLRDFQKQIETSITSISSQVATIDESFDPEYLSSQCANSLGQLLRGARSVVGNLTLLQNDLDGAINLLQCRKINAIYVAAIQNAFCTDAADGTAWAHFLLTIIAICSMVLVTLRAALYISPGEALILERRRQAIKAIAKDEHELYNRAWLETTHRANSWEFEKAEQAVPQTRPMNESKDGLQTTCRRGSNKQGRKFERIDDFLGGPAIFCGNALVGHRRRSQPADWDDSGHKRSRDLVPAESVTSDESWDDASPIYESAEASGDEGDQSSVGSDSNSMGTDGSSLPMSHGIETTLSADVPITCSDWLVIASHGT